jgi:hypothetical protein
LVVVQTGVAQGGSDLRGATVENKEQGPTRGAEPALQPHRRERLARIASAADGTLPVGGTRTVDRRCPSASWNLKAAVSAVSSRIELADLKPNPRGKPP